MARKVYINGEEVQQKKIVELHKIENERNIHKLLKSSYDRARRGKSAKVSEKEKNKLKK